MAQGGWCSRNNSLLIRNNCTLKSFLRPRIQDFAFCFGYHGCLGVKAGITTQQNLAGVRALRGAPKLFVGGELILDCLFECCFQFCYRFPVKTDNITDAGDVADKATILVAVFMRAE